MNESSLPSYTELNSALLKAEAPFLASQVHGYICGIICATSGKTDPSWEKALFGEKKSRTLSTSFQEIYENSFHLISEFSFEFVLLLPSDQDDINLRTEALGTWCQGFLTALKQCKIPLEKREPSEVTDAFNDLLEIAQVSYGDLKSNEEDEMAYFELVEYVRLAVLMIFHELKANDSQPTSLH